MKIQRKMDNDSKVETARQETQPLSLKDIRNLLELLEKHDVSEFKLERGEEKISLKRGAKAEESSGTQGASAAPQFYPTVHPSYLVPHSGYAAGVPQNFPPASVPQQVPFAGGQTAGQEGAKLHVVSNEGSPEVKPNKVFKEVLSPMVGTFYRRPAVDAEPYVSVGDSVKKGDVLCIVEAMKLMNEIECEFSGKIVEVCLDDGQMVEFGEVLFRLEP